MVDEYLVQVEFACKCGTELVAQCQDVRGGFVGSHCVACPTCGKGHETPTLPKRFFFSSNGTWQQVPVPFERAVASKVGLAP